MVKEAHLDIDLADVGRVQVRIFGDLFTVVGVLDSRRMKDLKDLDDEILTPADFAVTGGQAVQEIAEEEKREKQGLEDAKVVIKPFVHLEPANILIVPTTRCATSAAATPCNRWPCAFPRAATCTVRSRSSSRASP